MIPPFPPGRWVRLDFQGLIDVDGGWRYLVSSFNYCLLINGGMRGSLIYCPGITNDDAATTRIFRLTDPYDYQIALENPVVESFFECHGAFVRGGPLIVTPWDPDFMHPNTNYPEESLRPMARWQYLQTMAQPPSSTQQLLSLFPDDGPADEERGLPAIFNASTGLHLDVHLPSRFPMNFVPVGIAKYIPGRGWLSNIGSWRPRHCEGFDSRIIWECESIPGQISGWSLCDFQSEEEVIHFPVHERSTTTTTESTFIIGYVGDDKRLVEVYPRDIIDNDPIGAFQIFPSDYTASMTSNDTDYSSLGLSLL